MPQKHCYFPQQQPRCSVTPDTLLFPLAVKKVLLPLTDDSPQLEKMFCCSRNSAVSLSCKLSSLTPDTLLFPPAVKDVLLPLTDEYCQL